MMWEMVKLGDICNVRRGTTITKKNTIEGVVPVIGGGTKPTYFHNEANREAGCITVSGSGASAGYVNMWDEPIFASDCATIEVKNDEILQKFVYYFMQSQQEYIYQNFRSGAAQPHVYAKDIATLNFPILPLAEQQRIVAKLDAIFAGIDEAIELSQRQIIEVSKFGYRAISNSLENLRQNFGRASLIEVAVIQPKKKLALKKIGEKDQVSFMSMDGLGIEKKYSESEIKKPLKEVYKSYQYFENDDVIFAKITPCFENGKLGIVRNLNNGIGFGSSEFVVLRPNSTIKSEFLYYCLLDEVFRKEGVKNMLGAVGQKRVNKDYFQNYEVPLPSIDAQDSLVQKLDEIWRNTAIVVSTKQKKIGGLNALKSAILRQELQSEVA